MKKTTTTIIPYSLSLYARVLFVKPYFNYSKTSIYNEESAECNLTSFGGHSAGTSDDETSITRGEGGYTSMHEYGHYLQSQKNGFAYLFKFGLASAGGARWTETDANLRASKYFRREFNFEWNPNYYTGTFSSRYSNLAEREKNIKWWEWPIFPLSFFWF